MPSDQMYLPLHVGSEGKCSIGYTMDNSGDNLSARNANYCELTGLYWAWKNLNTDYLGLVHYRRHFSNGKILSNKRNRVITKPELERIIESSEVEIFLPKPRNYWIETNYSQYAHAHHAIDLDTTKAIIQEKYPEYIPIWESSMKKTSGHRFNMFIMSSEKLDSYCTWLFDVLFELEKRLDISSYSQNDRRVFGFISERLLDIWLETNGYKYRELPFVYMESQNWLVKGGNFIKRKLLGVRQK